MEYRKKKLEPVRKPNKKPSPIEVYEIGYTGTSIWDDDDDDYDDDDVDDDDDDDDDDDADAGGGGGDGGDDDDGDVL